MKAKPKGPGVSFRIAVVQFLVCAVVLSAALAAALAYLSRMEAVTTGVQSLPLTRAVTPLLILGAAACLIVFSALSLFLMRRFVDAPVTRIAQAAESAGSGGGAQAPDLPADGEYLDGLGHAARGLEGLIASVRALADAMAGKVESLRRAGDELSMNIEETAAAINQINVSIESTRPQMEEQSRVVERTSQTAERVSLTVEGLGAMIEGQSQAVSESAKAIEEMVASIRTVSANAETARSVTDELAGVSADGRAKLSSVIKAIDGIARQSTDLMSAAKIISGVAANTNLLAMNASIEAAHAGEWGKGFAVVADEIRQLAEKATRQSHEISKTLGGVKAGIDSAAKTSKETGTAFGVVFDKVETVGEIIQEIEKSMAEQNERTRQVMEGLGNINDVTVQVREGSIQMKEGSGQILSTVAKLTKVNAVVRDIMSQIAAGTAEINKAVSSVLSLVQTNAHLIDEAGAMASRLKRSGRSA